MTGSRSASDVAAAEGQRQAQLDGAADAITGGGQMVQVGPISFPVPTGWRSVPPASAMRAAEMRVGEGPNELLVTFMIVGGTVQVGFSTTWSIADLKIGVCR